MSPARLRFLILSGPTREYIDPVRYISNASSGRQGAAIAAAALAGGHEVDLVQGPVSVEPPRGAHLFPVESALEMLEAARKRHPFCDVFVAAAAVSDFRPRERLRAKHKKSGEGDRWILELVSNPDIAAELGETKEHRLHIGFALETDDAVPNARRKLERKRFDWVILDSPAAIGAAGGDYTLLGGDGAVRPLGRRSKEEIALLVVDLAERRP